MEYLKGEAGVVKTMNCIEVEGETSLTWQTIDFASSNLRTRWA